MEVRLSQTTSVSQEETEIIFELLERELHNLSGEIHHTRTLKFRDDLRRRHQLIENVLNRLRSIPDLRSFAVE